MIRRPPRSTLFPTRRSSDLSQACEKPPSSTPKAPEYLTFWVTISQKYAFSVRAASEALDSSSSFRGDRSEEHTSELQSPCNLVCRLLLEKKNTSATHASHPT